MTGITGFQAIRETSGNGFTKQEANETRISPRIFFFLDFILTNSKGVKFCSSLPIGRIKIVYQENKK